MLQSFPVSCFWSRDLHPTESKISRLIFWSPDQTQEEIATEYYFCYIHQYIVEILSRK